MTNKQLKGWLLAKRESGESSLRAVFFTYEQGIVHCLCKGWRKSNKKTLLQPFVPLWIVLDERKGWNYAKQIEITGSVVRLEGSALFSGLYLNELIYYGLKPFDIHEELYAAYQSSLNLLSSVKGKLDVEAILRRFEWSLLNHCGYAPDFTLEARGMDAVRPEFYYQYIAGEGLYKAERGIPGKHILALAHDNLDDPETLKTAKYIMRKAIHHFLDGREIKSRALFL